MHYTRFYAGCDTVSCTAGCWQPSWASAARGAPVPGQLAAYLVRRIDLGLARALAGFDAATRQAPWAVLVGPEGGFDPTELDAIKKQTIVTPVTLGRRLLRAETAAMAALACWQALVGDWT